MLRPRGSRLFCHIKLRSSFHVLLSFIAFLIARVIFFFKMLRSTVHSPLPMLRWNRRRALWQSFLSISISLLHQFASFLPAVCLFLIIAASQALVMSWTKSLACWSTPLESLRFSSSINWKRASSSVFHPLSSTFLVAEVSPWLFHILVDIYHYSQVITLGICVAHPLVCWSK